TKRPCISIQMEPKTKAVKGELKDWLKDNHDFKLKGFGFLVNKDVLRAEEVNIPAISDNEMDFYAEIVENDNVTEMNIFASFGYDIHISKEKYPQEYRALKSMTLDFLSEYLPDYYQDKVEDTQELLSDIQNERNDLKEDVEENEEEIAELKKENIDLKNEINEKNAKIKNTTKQLEAEKTQLRTINKKLQAKGNSNTSENQK
ncbi:MAG: hypothetical protein AAF573_22630, partial [Bacteroidota bacterium]